MIFLDTSFIVSLEVEMDTNHTQAKKIMEDIIRNKYGEPIISDYIFDESVTVIFAKTKDLKKTAELGEYLKISAKMQKVGEHIFDESWQIFKGQKITRFSFTDCATLSVMKSAGIINIATFDEDFKRIKEINVVCG